MTKPDTHKGMASHIAGSKGFALVATLMRLTVGLLSLSAVTLRSGLRESAVMDARANARLALRIALGELQKEMGTDMRMSTEPPL